MESQDFSWGIFLNKVEKADTVGKAFDHGVKSENVTVELALGQYLSTFIVSDYEYLDY